jgi:hypothetical protein
MLLVNFQHIDPVSLLVLPTLLGFCLLLLWFQRREEGRTLLDTPFRFEAAALPAAGVFLAAGGIGYSLDFLAAFSPLLAGGFAAFGLVWLPTVSLVLGVRSYRRMGRRKGL